MTSLREIKDNELNGLAKLDMKDYNPNVSIPPIDDMLEDIEIEDVDDE